MLFQLLPDIGAPLSPCPFCGSSKVQVVAYDPGATLVGHFVSCDGCGSHGPMIKAVDGAGPTSAATAWNSRGSNPT